MGLWDRHPILVMYYDCNLNSHRLYGICRDLGFRGQYSFGHADVDSGRHELGSCLMMTTHGITSSTQW